MKLGKKILLIGTVISIIGLINTNNSILSFDGIEKIGQNRLGTLILDKLSGLNFNNNDKILDVPIKNQRRLGLKYGCEAVATLMALEYKVGDKFDDYSWSISIPKDTTKYKTNGGFSGVYYWGNPEYGYVGDMTGKDLGSTINPSPLVKYIESQGYEADDLTGKSFNRLLKEVKKGNPVVAWVSINMDTPDNWIYWKTYSGEEVKATASSHAVTITGISDGMVYYNDPWTGQKDASMDKEKFEEIYNWRGRYALVIK